VVADIPGIIEGAAEGIGLGIQFLKHISRTRLLLHLVDVAPFDESVDPVEEVRVIETEMQHFDPELLEYERWLVLNKVDLIPEEEREAKCNEIRERLNWQGPVFMISAINKQGTQQLCYRIMEYIEAQRELKETEA
jgi:GTP-binding protein